MPALLSPSAYAHVFHPFAGANIRLFYDPCGNVGDGLIRRAERQLLIHFGITQDARKLDAVFVGGGGSMGSHYVTAVQALREARALADKENVPLVILPQSWLSPSFIAGDFQFARENASLVHCPGAQIAPDLALAYEWLEHHEPTQEEGRFFRADSERLKQRGESLGDPAAICRSPSEYLRLAARFRHVHTDRLHFAIAALLCGRRATLYANSYHKNRAVWELWLKGRGCSFVL